MFFKEKKTSTISCFAVRLGLIGLTVFSIGCSVVPVRAERSPEVLFEQIPNWDNAAMKICCSALTGNDYFKEGCDTNNPKPPRSKRC